MPGEFEGSQPSPTQIGTHEQPPLVPDGSLFSPIRFESDFQRPRFEISGIDIESSAPPIVFPELHLRTDAKRLLRVLDGLTPEENTGRVELLGCFDAIPRTELTDLKNEGEENPLADVFARMVTRTKQLTDTRGEAGITLAQQTTTVFREGENAIPQESQTLLVDAVLATLMDEAYPEHIQLAAQSAYDRLHTEEPPAEIQQEPGENPVLGVLRKVPVRVAAPVALIGSLFLAGCSQPIDVKAGILYTPTGETPAASAPTPTPTKERAKPATQAAKPTQQAPRPSATPTEKPSPTATKTEIPDTPTNTPEPSPTPEGTWCNKVEYGSESSNAAWNKKILDFRTKILDLINQGKDPAKEPVTDPVGLLTKIFVRNGRCGYTHSSQKDFDKAAAYGLTQQQIDTCKKQTLEPLTDEGWVNPKFWFFPETETDFAVKLDISEDGSGTCKWIREPANK